MKRNRNSDHEYPGQCRSSCLGPHEFRGAEKKEKVNGRAFSSRSCQKRPNPSSLSTRRMVASFILQTPNGSKALNNPWQLATSSRRGMSVILRLLDRDLRTVEKAGLFRGTAMSRNNSESLRRSAMATAGGERADDTCHSQNPLYSWPVLNPAARNESRSLSSHLRAPPVIGSSPQTSR